MQTILTFECLLFKYVLPKNKKNLGIPIACYWFVPELLYYNYTEKEAIYIRENILYKKKEIRKFLIEKTRCVICLNNIKLDNLYIANCGHVYHRCCISKWFKYSNACPTCRFNI